MAEIETAALVAVGFAEQSSAPATPAANTAKFYLTDDPVWTFIDENDANMIHVVLTVRMDGDGGGVASTNSITGATDTPTTDPGWTTSSSSDMNAPDGYIKAYVGTQAVVIPYWNT